MSRVVTDADLVAFRKIYLASPGELSDASLRRALEEFAAAGRDDTRDELEITDKILNTRTAVLKAIPGCPAHGDECVPHAIEWIHESIANNGRMAFLHSTHKDADGYEYGVAKVKHGPDGKLLECWWTASDHSDIDIIIAALAGRPLCHNCDTPFPPGCGGVFEDDGDLCAAKRAQKGAA